MILKELDPLKTTDPLGTAGRKAEEQMAHYLRRAFGHLPEVYLLHDLRLEQDGDAAQIDHLLLHRYGVMIIESKSVTAQVDVNERGEWCRNFRGQRRGMASPIEQARRQGEFLRAYLQAHREQLRGKYLLGLKQGGFLQMPLDVLVAISDDGIIRRPKRLDLPEVLKADQIPGRISNLLAWYRRANHPLFLKVNDGGYEFRPDELERITQFLLQRHHPHGRGRDEIQAAPIFAAAADGPMEMATDPASATVTPHLAPPVSNRNHQAISHRCRACQGEQLWVEWGRYGYYFKCANCGGNTPIRETCTRCGEKEKLRKSGPRFFAECGACSTSHLFYDNNNCIRTATGTPQCQR